MNSRAGGDPEPMSPGHESNVSSLVSRVSALSVQSRGSFLTFGWGLFVDIPLLKIPLVLIGKITDEPTLSHSLQNCVLLVFLALLLFVQPYTNRVSLLHETVGTVLCIIFT